MPRNTNGFQLCPGLRCGGADSFNGRLAGNDPACGVLLGPADMRSLNRQVCMALRQNGLGVIDQYRFDAGRSNIDSQKHLLGPLLMRRPDWWGNACSFNDLRLSMQCQNGLSA